VTKGKRKKGSEVEQFDFELDKMTKKDKRNVLEPIKRVRRQEDAHKTTSLSRLL
jgi:hypothetical protein